MNIDTDNIDKNGFIIKDNFYSAAEIRNLESFIRKNNFVNEDHFSLELENWQKILFNNKLNKLLKSINPRSVLVDAIYYDHQYPVDFQQTLNLPLKKRNIPHNLTLWGYPAEENYEELDKKELFKQTFAVQIFFKDTESSTGALKVIQGSHHRELGLLEIRLITDNVYPISCDVKRGGVVIQQPLLIKSVEISDSPKKKQSIVLWFSSYHLPVQYIWNIEQ